MSKKKTKNKSLLAEDVASISFMRDTIYIRDSVYYRKEKCTVLLSLQKYYLRGTSSEEIGLFQKKMHQISKNFIIKYVIFKYNNK